MNSTTAALLPPNAVSETASSVADTGRWLVTTMITAPLMTAAVVIAAAATQAGLRVILRWVQHRRLFDGARLLRVLVPPHVDPDGAAALWGNLAGLLRPRWKRRLVGQPHLCFEYLITPAGSTIRIWIAGPVPPGLVEHAVTAAWPGATTHTTPADPAPAVGPGWRAVTAGGTLRLARPHGLPIGDNAPGDPVAALLAAPGDLHAAARDTAGPDAITPADHPRPPVDQVVVQVLARPVGAQRAAGGRGSIRGGLIGTVGVLVVWGVREILTLIAPGPLSATDPAGRGPRTPTNPTGEDRRTRLEHASGDRAAVTKARRASFETLVRYAATIHIEHPVADPEARRAELRAARRQARGRAHAVAAVFASFGDHNYYRRRRLRRPDQAIAERRLGRGDLLSITELAAIATLPTAGHTPGLIRAGARSVAPPPGLPIPGPDVKPLGDTTTGGVNDASCDTGLPGDTAVAGGAVSGGVRRGRPVGVRVADARQHLHVIGATGSGKSTLLVQLILADIHAGRGVVVIDPKGDLVTDITHRLPASLRARAVIIDPDMPGAPPCLNPLGIPHPSVSHTTEDEALAVETLVSIFQRVFSAFWGPRTDDLMRAACLTLAAQPTPRTLADLPTLLTDSDVRARHLRAVHDPLLRGFWNWYDQLSEPARAQATAPLMNKIRAVLLRPFTRAVLTGYHPTPGRSSTSTARTPAMSTAAGAVNTAMNTVDMPGVLDGGILLARLPKGRLSDEGTRLVGSIVVAQTWAAATARTALPQHQRRDAGLVIDECHNFLNLPYGIPEILAEARGLRLSLTLAHQNLAQLPRDLREGISANARNKIIFTVGPDDARALARHTLPHLGEHDLAHLDAFHAAARLVNQGGDTPAFTLRTRPLPSPGSVAPSGTELDQH